MRILKRISSASDRQLINKLVHWAWSVILFSLNKENKKKLDFLGQKIIQGSSQKNTPERLKTRLCFLSFAFKRLAVVMGQSCCDPGLFFVKKQKVSWKITSCTNLAISVLEISPPHVDPNPRNGGIYQFQLKQGNLKSAEAITVVCSNTLLVQYPGKFNTVIGPVNGYLFHSLYIYPA